MVTSSAGDDLCAVSMPDNPYTADSDGAILPCQLAIQTNCSAFCNVQLQFDKFDLEECEENVTDVRNDFTHCHLIDKQVASLLAVYMG